MSKSQAIILFFLRITLLVIGGALAGISGAILYLNPKSAIGGVEFPFEGLRCVGTAGPGSVDGWVLCGGSL